MNSNVRAQVTAGLEEMHLWTSEASSPLRAELHAWFRDGPR